MPYDSTFDPITDVILGAIDWLEKRGWHKGWEGPDGSICIFHALSLGMARSGSVPIATVIERVRQANGIEIDLPFWNDAKDRTKEQVLDALRNSLL